MKNMKIAAIIIAAVIIGIAAGYAIGRRSPSVEKFDASKVRDPKVRAEMEYLKKMYFS